MLRDQYGHLTREIISTSKSVPALSAYYHRFGTLRRAYELIRFYPATAQQRAQKSRRYASDQALLHALRWLLQKHGRLSRKIIEGDAGAPARGTLVRRFGSLLRAYGLVGYTPEPRQGGLRGSSSHLGLGS